MWLLWAAQKQGLVIDRLLMILAAQKGGNAAVWGLLLLSAT